MHTSRAVSATNRTVVVPFRLGMVVSVQRGSRGELEMVVEGVRRCWFQRWEGTDIVGALGKSMGRVGLVAKSREVVVEGHSVLVGNLRGRCLWWKEVVVEGIGSLGLG